MILILLPSLSPHKPFSRQLRTVTTYSICLSQLLPLLPLPPGEKFCKCAPLTGFLSRKKIQAVCRAYSYCTYFLARNKFCYCAHTVHIFFPERMSQLCDISLKRGDHVGVLFVHIIGYYQLTLPCEFRAPSLSENNWRELCSMFICLI